MKEITFTRPFVWINYEGYCIPPHIVAFGRACVEWKNEDMGKGMGRSIVSKYRCDLEINLWLIVLRFSWLMEAGKLSPFKDPRQ